MDCAGLLQLGRVQILCAASNDVPLKCGAQAFCLNFREFSKARNGLFLKGIAIDQKETWQKVGISKILDDGM